MANKFLAVSCQFTHFWSQGHVHMAGLCGCKVCSLIAHSTLIGAIAHSNPPCNIDAQHVCVLFHPPVPLWSTSIGVVQHVRIFSVITRPWCRTWMRCGNS